MSMLMQKVMTEERITGIKITYSRDSGQAEFKKPEILCSKLA